MKTKIIIGICIIVAFILTDFLSGSNKQYRGTVLDKHYTSASSSHGTGVGVMSNGEVGAVSTSTYTPEKFELVVKLSNGDIEKIPSSLEVNYTVEKEDVIEFTILHGGITTLAFSVDNIKVIEEHDGDF